MVKANASSSLRGSRSFCSTCRTMAGDTDPLLVQAREGRGVCGYDTLPLGTAYGTNGRVKRRILVATAAVAVSALLTAVILTSTSYRIEDLARWDFAPGIEWLVHARNEMLIEAFWGVWIRIAEQGKGDRTEWLDNACARECCRHTGQADLRDQAG